MKQFLYPSSSDVKVNHTVTVYPDNRITCSCRGYRSPNKCWHFRDTAKKLGIDINEASKEGQIIPVAIQGSLLESEREIPFKPMLARGLKDEETIHDYPGDIYVLEEKYNGHRMLIETGPVVTAWSRAGNIRMLPSHLIKELNKMPKALIDSELYIPGGQSTDVTALHLQDQLVIAIFDIMNIEGESIINDPLYKRRKALDEAASHLQGPVNISDQFEPNQTKLDEIWNRGGEGAILKRRDSPYEVGYRSKAWIKFKKEETEIAKIVSFEMGLLGPYSRVVAIDKFGVEISVKMLNDEWRATLEREGGAKYLGWILRFKHRGRTRDKKKYISPMMDHIYEDN